MSTTDVRQSDKDTTELPRWLQGMDPSEGERALEGFDLVIKKLKADHESAINRCLLHAWHDPFGDGRALFQLMHIRQHLAVAIMLRERTVKLVELLRAKAA